jgi:ATP-dependent Lhr-like helicase
VWKAALAGQSGLLHANTGAGKTYAVWFAALLRGANRSRRDRSGLRVLWITPMRALAADTQRSLEVSAAELGAASPDAIGAWTIGARTGDTGSAERARQSKSLPGALITTPEPVAAALARGARDQFKHLDMIIIDEWHELMGSKRGVQVQLALARLRRWNPELVVWGLSATMGNLQEARSVLLGAIGEEQGVLVEGDLKKQIVVDCLIPENVSRFPWGGHLGLQMLQPVIDEIDKHEATLVFTNTRSQSEIWYQNLIEARPDWAGVVALHHGSLDREVREWVEGA